MPELEEMVRELAEQIRALEKRMDSPMYSQEIKDQDD